MLPQLNIEYLHVNTEDFTAMSVADHTRISQLINARRGMGGILFYCGYGQGRTGTAVAGVLLKYILFQEPQILVNLTGKQLHSILCKGFGVERVEQTQSIVDYLNSLATVEAEEPNTRPLSLDEIGNMSIEDRPDFFSYSSYPSLHSLPDLSRPLPPLPSTPPEPPPKIASRPKPPLKIASKPKSIRVQSLDPIGKLRNSSASEWGRQPCEHGAYKPTSSLTKKYMSSNGHVNLESFYFNKSALDDISV